jgi:excinuclease UvrABC nuclease subunit
LRKTTKTARDRSKLYTTLSLDQFGKNQRLRSLKHEEDSFDSPGLYWITGSRQENMYVGSALNLRRRVSTQFAADRLDHWLNKWGATSIRRLPKPEVTDPIDLLSMQKRLIQLASPSLNVLGPTAA